MEMILISSGFSTETGNKPRTWAERRDACQMKIEGWLNEHGLRIRKSSGSRNGYYFSTGLYIATISYSRHTCYIELSWHIKAQVSESYVYKKFGFEEFLGIDIDDEIKELEKQTGYEPKEKRK